MNILRHLYLSSAARSPDEPVAPEPVVDPVAEPVAEPVVEPQPEPLPDPDPAAAAAPAPAPAAHGNAGKSPWYMRELAQTREEKRQANTARDAAEQRAADLQAIIERMQASGDPATATGKPAAQPTAQRPADFAAAVKAQAARDRFVEDTISVRDTGLNELPDFPETLRIVEAIGVTTNDDFVADILAVDKPGAHKILDKLAKDPEKAASLVGMDSRRRIAELTRMADAPKSDVKPAAPVVEPKPAASISRAPAPKPAANPLAPPAQVDPTTAEGNEKMSDQEWECWYKEKHYKRA